MLFLTPIHTNGYDIPKSYLMIEYKGEDNYNKQLKKIAAQNPESVCYHTVKDKQGKQIDSYIGVLTRKVKEFEHSFGLIENKFYFSLQEFESEIVISLNYKDKQELKALFDTHKDGFIFID